MRKTPAIVKAVRRRMIESTLGIDLEQPYFSRVDEIHMVVGRKCLHREHGFELNEVDRTVTCRNCRKIVDPFTALWNYSKAEERLLRTREAIEENRQAELRRKERARERVQFQRRVTSRKPIRNMEMKSEPITGYELTLECKHTVEVAIGQRKMNNVTCRACEATASK